MFEIKAGIYDLGYFVLDFFLAWLDKYKRKLYYWISKNTSPCALANIYPQNNITKIYCLAILTLLFVDLYCLYWLLHLLIQCANKIFDCLTNRYFKVKIQAQH